MEILLAAAIIPVVLLCFYIYKKDQHKEPKNLLISLLVLGALSCIPIIIGEVIVGEIVGIEDDAESFFEIFFIVFISVALIEEGFKWLVTYFKGYKNREFDEIYDIIVYSVYASLGFACIENIMYVFSYGFETAILRAVTSVPGHACFGILMGYYLSKAKVGEINGQKSIKSNNVFLSILIPTLFHTFYDSILTVDSDSAMIIFIIFDIAMVVYCFLIVKKMSKIQQNLSTNINKGFIKESKQGTINYVPPKIEGVIKFCPICGRSAEGNNFCPQCGFKLK